MDLVLVQCGVDPWLVPMVVVWALQRLRLGGKRCLLLLRVLWLVCPVGMGSQLKLTARARDNSSVRSLAVEAQDVARTPPELSAAGTPKTGKRRTLVEERTQQSQREAFHRLFHPTGHPAGEKGVKDAVGP